PQAVDEGALLTFTVMADDPDGDALTLSVAPLPPGALFAGGVFSWMPGYDAAGVYPLTLAASDGALTDTAEVTITVRNVNRAPALAPVGPQAVDEGALLTFTVMADDPDGDALTLSVAPLPPGALFAGGVFSWMPGYDAAGVYPLTLAASDGALTDTAEVTITVRNVNRAPALAPVGPQAVDEGALLTFTVMADDPDGDALTLSVAPLPPGALFAGGVFSWMPGYDAAGVYPLTLAASDGALTDTAEVTITVRNVNRAPALAPVGPQAVDEGALLTFTVMADDPDGDALTFSAAPLPPGALFAGGVFSWMPGCEAAGIYTTTFVVSDGVLSDTEAVSITVVEACSVSRFIYLPLVLRAYGPRALLGPFPAISAQPVAVQGSTFYTALLSLMEPLPTAGRFYFSGAPDRVAPVMVDDRLALTRAGQDVFTYTFSSDGAPPLPAVVELPRAVAVEIAAGGVRLEYQDVYGALISADALWLIWVP
ncbi:MAG: putative Ig domain-containing protein, partial [Anaerolineae bacterium]